MGTYKVAKHVIEITSFFNHVDHVF